MAIRRNPKNLIVPRMVGKTTSAELDRLRAIAATEAPAPTPPAPATCGKPMHKACRCIRRAGHELVDDIGCNCTYPEGDR